MIFSTLIISCGYTCFDGRPPSGSTDGNIFSCVSCNDGYYLDDDACRANVYTCANGTAASDATPGGQHNSDFCASCTSDYVLDTSMNTCREPLYTCANGIPISGAPTEGDNFENCLSCVDGYYLGTDDTTGDPICVTNVYTCVNGTAVDSGTPGANNGDALCASCLSGHTLTRARVSSEDFDTLLGPGNTNPTGIWSNGMTMWVADSQDRIIYAYDFATTTRDASKDIDLGRMIPVGIWSNGTTMWVSTLLSDALFAYDLITGERDSSQDFAAATLTNAGNEGPFGLWSDGETMWVSDGTADPMIYAYNLGTKARAESKDIQLTTTNTVAYGLWSDGETMWVADDNGDRIYAYTLATGAYDPDKDFNALGIAGNTDMRGIWSDGMTMWSADIDDDKLYAHNLATKAYTPDRDFNTLSGSGNLAPSGIWSDGTTMWVTDITNDKIYAYNLATKVYTPENDFNTLSDSGNMSPYGIWSDGTTMWVTNSSSNNHKIYAYDLATKAYTPENDFNTLMSAGNTGPRGLWSDGTTMWVSHNLDPNRIYAYDFDTKRRDMSKEFDIESAGLDEADGIWSDGMTMWVANDSLFSPMPPAAIYAFDFIMRDRVESRDFNGLPAAENSNPAGIWSDGTTMWVVDHIDTRIYAYALHATCAPDS